MALVPSFYRSRWPMEFKKALADPQSRTPAQPVDAVQRIVPPTQRALRSES
jgi:hypothetical protein